MKNSKLLLFLFLCMTVFNTFGQHSSGDFFERLHANVSQPDRGFFVNIQLGSSEIMNADLNKSDNSWAINRQLGYSFDFGFNYRLRNLLAAGIGLGMSSYSMNITSADVITRVISDQLDNSAGSEAQRRYDAIMEYHSLSQNTTLTYLNIPVFVEFGNLNYDRMGFYIRTSLNASIPIADQFSASGDYTQTGYYEYFSTFLPQIPGLFVFEEALYSGESHYELNPLILTAGLSVGVTFPLAGGIMMSMGPVFSHSLIDIAQPTNFSNKAYWNDFNHLLELDSNASTLFFGMQVRFQYSSGVFFGR